MSDILKQLDEAEKNTAVGALDPLLPYVSGSTIRALIDCAKATKRLTQLHLDKYAHGEAGKITAKELGWKDDSDWGLVINALAKLRGDK